MEECLFADTVFALTSSFFTLSNDASVTVG